MSCFRPNIGLFKTNVEPRERIEFHSGNKKGHELNYEWFNSKNEWYKKYLIPMEYIQLPCGQCEACQEAYSKEWAIRCVLEAEQWKHNYFITLTYKDEELFYPEEIVDQATGEIYQDDGTWEKPSLNPKDMELFMKKLRRYWEYHYNHKGCRMYYAGEYGSQSARPHFHLLAFNLPIKPDDLKIYRINMDGSIYYTCDKITKIWGKGHVVIGEVNWDTCAYTARYVMKKMKYKPKRWYYEHGLYPEFVRMSRKPGIGEQAYDPSIYENDEIIIKGHKQSIKNAKPPRYYDKIYDIENHENMVKIKQRRQELASASQKNEIKNTSLSIREHLLMKQRIKHDTWGSLQRNKV